MKLLSLFFCLLIAVGARAANPAFGDFNLTQFGTNASAAGNGVRIKGGAALTNVVIYLGFTNYDGTICLSNQINHSFFLVDTNGNWYSSNAVVGAYACLTNGTFYCSSNATIGGVLSVLSGSSTTVSNLINNGTYTGDLGGGTNFYATNLVYPVINFASSTNALALNNDWATFDATTNVAITNFSWRASGTNWWGGLWVSNSSAGTIAVFVTAAGRLMGTASTTANTNGLPVPAGKMALVSAFAKPGNYTNWWDTVQQ